ncbi:MAG: hypothetical protein R3324_00180 [Halobacteriales archaeon]|nr:hypothetical protein [Halobacteriales archaeon]
MTTTTPCPEEIRGTDPNADYPIDRMRKMDARLALGRLAGTRQNPRSRLTKRTLNALHFGVCGEVHFPMWAHRTRHSSSLEELRVALASEVYDRVVDEDDAAVLESYLREVEGHHARSFRARELQVLVRWCRRIPDKRPMLRKSD